MKLPNQLRYRLAQLSFLERLILVIVIAFVLPFIVKSILFLFNIPFDFFFEWLTLSHRFDLLLFRPWSLLTYGFLHSNLSHIFWNMLLLYFSGRMLLNLFAQQVFINTFFIGIITGGVLYLLSYNIFPAFLGQNSYLIGSSAGVMAVLIFICSYMPNNEVRLVLFNVKLLYIGLFFVILDVIQIPTGNAGGHLAHLGGALWGYVYQQQYSKGNDVGQWFSKMIDWLKGFFTSKPKIKTAYRTKKPYKKRPKTKSQQEKIDSILDKISKSGYESLTKEEKDFLFQAGKDS